MELTEKRMKLVNEAVDEFYAQHTYLCIDREEMLQECYVAVLEAKRVNCISKFCNVVLQKLALSYGYELSVVKEEEDTLGAHLEELNVKVSYDFENKVFKENISNAIKFAIENALTERERIVIEKRFFSNESLYDISRDFKVGAERIRQIEAKALRRLKHPKYSHAYSENANMGERSYITPLSSSSKVFISGRRSPEFKERVYSSYDRYTNALNFLKTGRMHNAFIKYKSLLGFSIIGGYVKPGEKLFEKVVFSIGDSNIATAGGYLLSKVGVDLRIDPVVFNADGSILSSIKEINTIFITDRFSSDFDRDRMLGFAEENKDRLTSTQLTLLKYI